MLNPIVCLYDRNTKCFLPPIVVPHISTAKVQLYGLVNTTNDDEPLFTNPEQFCLFQLGEFNNETGVISTASEKELLFECDSLRDDACHELDSTEDK